MRILGLDHVAFAVPDQEASIAWYCKVLGLEREHENAWGAAPAVLGAADSTGLALFRVSERRPAGFRHVAFRVDAAGLEEARMDLAGTGIVFEEQDHRIARSIYFLDPDGVRVELTTYEV
jgi:catechol 2,3-dioxygenase-like lactoylglutathione lyase family enzyme